MRSDQAPSSPIVYALVSLPAIALGVLAMALGGVSPMLWAQQPAAWVIFMLLALFARRAALRVSPVVCTALFLIVLAATWFGAETDGARRWLDLGLCQVNAAMLVLPALLTVLYGVKQPCPALLCAAVVLCFQPDISQLAAFSAAVLPLIWLRRKQWQIAAGCMIALAALMIRCILVPLSLQPVSYCEGILTMLGEVSWILKAAGWGSLTGIPAFFIYQFCRQGRPQMLSLAAYYAVTMAFIFSGDYPVPFMGFGLSPIAGYWLAYICSNAGSK